MTGAPTRSTASISTYSTIPRCGSVICRLPDPATGLRSLYGRSEKSNASVSPGPPAGPVGAPPSTDTAAVGAIAMPATNTRSISGPPAMAIKCRRRQHPGRRCPARSALDGEVDGGDGSFHSNRVGAAAQIDVHVHALIRGGPCRKLLQLNGVVACSRADHHGRDPGRRVHEGHQVIALGRGNREAFHGGACRWRQLRRRELHDHPHGFGLRSAGGQVLQGHESADAAFSSSRRVHPAARTHDQPGRRLQASHATDIVAHHLREFQTARGRIPRKHHHGVAALSRCHEEPVVRSKGQIARLEQPPDTVHAVAEDLIRLTVPEAASRAKTTNVFPSVPAT